MLTFGHDTIRKLPKNVSELSKLAARDYEDILQVRVTTTAQKPLIDYIQVLNPGIRWSISQRGQQEHRRTPVSACYLACLRQTAPAYQNYCKNARPGL